KNSNLRGSCSFVPYFGKNSPKNTRLFRKKEKPPLKPFKSWKRQQGYLKPLVLTTKPLTTSVYDMPLLRLFTIIFFKSWPTASIQSTKGSTSLLSSKG